MKTLHYSIIIASLLGLSLLSTNHVYAPCIEDEMHCGDIRPLPHDTRPLKLFEEHFSSDRIPCKQGLYLAIKSQNQEPVCLKAGTISKLASRGFFYGISANESQSYYTTILIPPGSEYESSNKTYSPDATTIRLGENSTVQWVNQANTTDTLVADTPFEQYGVPFESPALHPGESYEFTFATVGAYGYHDKSHPWQRGIIHVLGNPSGIKLEKTILNKTDSTSSLKLYLSSSPTVIKPGQPVDISISVNNTSKNPIQYDAQDAWSFGNVQTGVCARIGYGISVLDGYYTIDNLTQATSMPVFNPAVMCPFISEHAQEYEFQPSSGMVKEIKCDQPQNAQCNPESYHMGNNYRFSGYWDAGAIKPFKSGVYTIVGADEWGHVETRYFIVTNSTIFAGALGALPCPMGLGFETRMQNFTGFSIHFLQDQQDYFILHPGMQGKVNLQYHAPENAMAFQNNASPFNFNTSSTLIYMSNVTRNGITTPFAVSLYTVGSENHSQVCHSNGWGFTEPCNIDNNGDIPPNEIADASELLHSGIKIAVEPEHVMLYKNSNAIFTGLVTAGHDAREGSYWLVLGGGLCGPSVMSKLVILP